MANFQHHLSPLGACFPIPNTWLVAISETPLSPSNAALIIYGQPLIVVAFIFKGVSGGILGWTEWNMPGEIRRRISCEFLRRNSWSHHRWKILEKLLRKCMKKYLKNPCRNTRRNSIIKTLPKWAILKSFPRGRVEKGLSSDCLQQKSLSIKKTQIQFREYYRIQYSTSPGTNPRRDISKIP